MESFNEIFEIVAISNEHFFIVEFDAISYS